MTSHSAQRIFNSRERATVIDQTRQIDLSYRMVQQALFGSVSGDRTESGVIKGLKVTIDAGARTATVGTGLALISDPETVYPDSAMLWIEVTSPITVNIAAGTAFDRWDVIEIEPSSTVTIPAAVVDRWDPTIPPNGSFAPDNVDKELQSVPIVTIKVGSDNTPNPPNFPTGTASKLPLAYLFVDGSGDVSGGTAGIARCRPMLMPIGAMDPTETRSPGNINGLAWVQGGGIDVRDPGAAVSDTALQFQSCIGRFTNGRQTFSLGLGAQMLVNALDSWETQAKPSADAVGYAYAFPIPFPTALNPLADREFIVGSSVVTRFPSITQSDQVNCGIVLSETVIPDSESADASPQGSTGTPLETNTIDINDWPFRTGTTRATVFTEKLVFLGAFDFNETLDEAMQQDYMGAGRVAMTGRVCAVDILAMGAGGGAAIEDVDLHNPDNSLAEGYQGIVPETAHELDVLVRYAATAAAGVQTNNIDIIDDNVREMIEGGEIFSTKSFRMYQDTSITVNVDGMPVKLFTRTTSGGSNISVSYARATGVTLFALITVGYLDKILAMR